MEKNRKKSLKWMIWPGNLLIIGGAILVSYHFWAAGVSILGIGVACFLAGIYGEVRKKSKEIIEKRKKEPEVYAFFWKSVFSWSLFRQDMAENLKGRKLPFFMGLFHCLCLSTVYILAMIFPIMKGISEGQLIWPAIGIFSFIILAILGALWVRGYGMVSVSDTRKSIRSLRSFLVGSFGVVCLLCLGIIITN